MAVFLSYAREDAERLAALRDELENLHPPLWYDARLAGGQEWWDEILRQIRGCDVFVLALTRASVRSEACRAEAEYAFATARPFLGVLVEDVDQTGLDERIRRRQHVPFPAADLPAVRALARAILGVGAAPPLPQPLPPPPPLPAAYEDRYPLLFGGPLGLDDQISVFARLRFDIENGEQADRARALLERLYQRAELSWKIRQDIDAFRAGPPPAPAAAPPIAPPVERRTSRPGRRQCCPPPQLRCGRPRTSESCGLTGRRGQLPLRLPMQPLDLEERAHAGRHMDRR